GRRSYGCRRRLGHRVADDLDRRRQQGQGPADQEPDPAARCRAQQVRAARRSGHLRLRLSVRVRRKAGHPAAPTVQSAPLRYAAPRSPTGAVTPGAPRPATTTVLIDAQPLSSVAAGGGVGTYLRELLAAVGRRDDLVLRALCPAGVDLPSGVAPVPVRRLFSRPRLEATEHSLRLGVEVWRHQQDGLFHNPSFHAPAGLRSPWVQTLLDLIPLIDGSPDQRVLRKRWRRFGPRYRRADAIVAISQHA